MFSKYSEDAQKVLMYAKKEMQELKHSYVGSEHLFLALLKFNKEFSSRMKTFGVTYARFKDKLVELVGIGEEENNWFLYTPLLKKIIDTASFIARNSSSNEVTSIHLIYAILDEDDGIAIRILESFDIDLIDLKEYYSVYLTTKRKGNNKKLLIEELGVDLTLKATNLEIDPVVGRDDEINRIIEILCRRTKNNPLLIGEAGVGKTALVEELARLIVNNKVPIKLRNKRIISVSMASLVSGTKYRGEFEERVTKMLNELENNDDIYLFIDEIHTIMGAGGAEGAIDAANIFKPALSRGKIKLIGATTNDEYKKTIEKDRAMERRFQTVFIEEPSIDKTLDILKTLKPIYEDYHSVRIDDSLLKEIVNLTDKYIHDRFQPDKSIDILDEVCSKISLKNSKQLVKLDSYKEKLNEYIESKNRYLLNQDYSNATKVAMKERELQTKINNLELNNNKKSNIKSIKLSDIQSIISLKTSIPMFNIDKFDKKYINVLSTHLMETIIGQKIAISELIVSTKRFGLGYKQDNKPLSFLFVGPTGVGKTELAIEYGKYLFNNKIIRIDGSEYKDSSSINKLLGSAPGYVGYDDNKNKLEEIRNNPYSLILFDEIEKAHPSILNLFLQILDEGSITDNKGNIIHFENTIIIMTSNIGYNKENLGFIEEISKNDSKLKEFLPMELLNRIKKVIYFNKLNEEDIKNIINRKISKAREEFKDSGIKLSISSRIINKIIEKSRYLEFGARKLDYVIEEEIDNYIIDSILEGKKEILIK